MIIETFLSMLMATLGGNLNLCQLNSLPEVIALKPHELHQVWTLDDSEILWSENSSDEPTLAEFRNEVLKRIHDVRPVAILQRRYRNFMASKDPIYLSEAENSRLALSGAVGKIRPISCLETLLLAIQTRRQSMIGQPSEFAAFILRGGQRAKVRIYYSTQDSMGIRGVQAELERLMTQDLASGWILWTHLHNHPFDFDNRVDILGGPSPSLSDVSAYRSHSAATELRSACVTNGFSTIEIARSEFSKFKSHEDQTPNH